MPLGLVAFLVSIAYWPGITSAAVAPRWWVILIGAPLALACAPGLSITKGHLYGLAFFLTGAASLAWSVSPIDTLDSLILLLGLAAVFCAAAEAETLELVWIGLGAGTAINVLFALAFQRHTEMVGLFLQRDFFGAFAAASFVGLLMGARHRPVAWALLAFSAIALCITHSRGAILAVVVAVFVKAATYLSPRGRWIGAGTLVAVCTGGLAIDYFFLASSLSRMNITLRFVEWDWVAQNLHLFGWGLNTLGSIFTFEHAENELLELAFDLGILSVVFWVFVAQAMRIRPNASSFVLIAILVDGLTSFPLHNPGTAFVAAVALGNLCGARGRLFDSGRAGTIVRLADAGGWWHQRPFGDIHQA